MVTRTTATTLAIAALVIGGLGGYAISRGAPSYPSAPDTGGPAGPTNSAPASTTQRTYNYNSTTNINQYPIPAPAVSTAKTTAFDQAMKNLWDEHVRLTRQYILDASASSTATTSTAAALMRNQEDIGDAIKPYYGNAAGDTLTALLKTHIQQAADVVAATKDNDQQSLSSLKTQWFANADQIASFLADTNSNWTYSHIDGHMHDHLNLTLNEATAQLNGDQAQSLAYYSQIKAQIEHLALDLSSGIEAQFPDRFR